MNPRELKKEAVRVLESLPDEFRQQLHNVAVVVEQRASRARLRELDLDPRQDTLYGLYEGIPLPERSASEPPLVPDKITIFAEPLLEDFPDRADLREQIRITVLHEIAHYFGIDEEEIEGRGY